MKLELFDDDGNYIPNPSEPRPIEGEPMTIEGAIAELQNLIKADDVPFYYNGAIQKVIETIIDECKPKAGKWEECKVVDIEDTTITEIQSAYCPICHKYHTTPYMYYFDYFNYCPNCGAKMERSE